LSYNEKRHDKIQILGAAVFFIRAGHVMRSSDLQSGYLRDSIKRNCQKRREILHGDYKPAAYRSNGIGTCNWNTGVTAE